ncbi:MAG: formylglycine-generating enzyme family protein [bacterium]|nr:formylglycine-generating enzyme family protein [bacterium]
MKGAKMLAGLTRAMGRLVLGAMIATGAMADSAEAAEAGPRIAFLAAEASVEAMGTHNRGAWKSAQTLGDVTLLLAGKEGFVDASGSARALADFDVAWYHQGDAIAHSALYRDPGISAILEYAKEGGAVLLSGGALAMIAPLKLESLIRAQRSELENFRDPAAMVVVERQHPAFAGLEEEGGVVWLSRGGCTAVADFYWGGPGNGMVLANTPQGVQRPLVEYTLGKGRVIVFGWHWPDYADTDNPYRANLMRLTRNLAGYLADSESWQPVVIRSDYPPVAYPDVAGIAEPRWRALRLAVEDLSREFPDTYAKGGEFLARIDALYADHDRVPADAGPDAYASLAERFDALQREALLANPLINFDQLLMIRRRGGNLGLPMNFNGNADLSATGYSNTLVTLSPPRPGGAVETVFQPEGDPFIGDLDLHYDGETMLMSIPDESGRWGVGELALESGTLKRLPLIEEPDVHNYDACYLPDERLIFTSTAPFVGVPCVGGRSKVANLYLRDHGGRIRRLTNDQDHNWCPAVLNNGRVLYQRWEYTDIAHTFTRLLFHANPDGSRQMEFYGSNSYWPTAMFYARPVPNHPTKVVAVIGGHHDAPRQGELVVFDPALGRQEADGAVQRIPGYGKKIQPVILDGLIHASWPRFLHPYPLSEKYFLVSCKPTKPDSWGVYLVDVFDNFVLLHQEPGWAMLEPTPWRKTKRQPVVADVADPEQTEATVLLTDVYRGPGLEGVPRGAVKSLRLSSYNFAFQGVGAEPFRVGLDGPWDVRRILGTVPVEADGSASFRVPSCTPITVQPLDADGKALALMRSWFTGMPGEVVSCVGCHEKQNMTVPADATPLAARRDPSVIKPWYGPARGFSFAREVQPVLDAYCVECHHGEPLADGRTTFDLTAKPAAKQASAFQMLFSPSYMALRRWVHTPTLESDAHMLPPRDFHADTSTLVQVLRDGHHGVRLSDEAWDRLITWIDLNAPFHGTWKEVVARNAPQHAAALNGAKRRHELHRRHSGIDVVHDAIHPAAVLEAESPGELAPAIDIGEAQVAPVPAIEQDPVRVELKDGVFLELARVEPGQFVMGSDRGYPNELPAHRRAIEKPFLMGRFEVTNRQYACFDPAHDSGMEGGEAYQFGDDERGWPLDRPEQPVVRVSWDEAVAFCEWLSTKTGKIFTLPDEAQWEYACRAGTASPMWYGTLDDSFSAAANLSDATHHTVYYPHVPAALPPWRPADTRFDDGWRVAAYVGSFSANAWGLHDMHGNVAEWTGSEYGAYGESAGSVGSDRSREMGRRKVVRGGSWLDRPVRARSAFRLHYEASQAVHDVGFRVVCEVGDSSAGGEVQLSRR